MKTPQLFLKLNSAMMKTQRLSFFLFILFLFNFSFAFAQTGVVHGIVKDANGQILSGASVTVQGSSKGTTTDNNGNYSISLSPGKYTVVVSYVGFSSQRNEVTVSEKPVSLDFVLMSAG